jgi:hypothetical protein
LNDYLWIRAMSGSNQSRVIQGERLPIALFGRYGSASTKARCMAPSRRLQCDFSMLYSRKMRKYNERSTKSCQTHAENFPVTPHNEIDAEARARHSRQGVPPLLYYIHATMLTLGSQCPICWPCASTVHRITRVRDQPYISAVSRMIVGKRKQALI